MHTWRCPFVTTEPSGGNKDADAVSPLTPDPLLLTLKSSCTSPSQINTLISSYSRLVSMMTNTEHFFLEWYFFWFCNVSFPVFSERSFIPSFTVSVYFHIPKYRHKINPSPLLHISSSYIRPLKILPALSFNYFSAKHYHHPIIRSQGE